MNFPGFSSADRVPKEEIPPSSTEKEAANDEYAEFNDDFIDEIAERLAEVRHIITAGRHDEEEKQALVDNYRILRPYLEELKKIDLDNEISKDVSRGKRLKALKLDLQAEIEEINKIIQ